MFPLRKLRIQCPVNCKKSYCIFIHRDYESLNSDSKRKGKEPQNQSKRSKVCAVKPPAPVPKLTSPVVEINIKTTVKQKNRQKAADKFFIEFNRIYENLNDSELVRKHTLQQEIQCCQGANDLSYTNTVVAVLRRLRKRAKAVDELDIGIDGEYKERVAKEPIPIEKLNSLVLSPEMLQKLEYPQIELITNEKIAIPNMRECDRCSSTFIPSDELSNSQMEECVFHPKRFYKTYLCCKAELGASGCTSGPHVFKITSDSELHHFIPFEEFNGKHGYPVLALDCEMAYTLIGMELVRISVVNWYGDVVLDTLVQTLHPVLCLNTMYSGVASLEGVTETISSIKAKLQKLISKDTILVGHGLENDLRCLRIVHNKIIDTIDLFPHEKGLPFRNSLKNLVKMNLGKFIQEGEHSSIEDAVACLELVKKKIS